MNTLKVILLLSSLTGLPALIDDRIGKGRGMVIALVISVLMNIGGYRFSDSIVLRMHNARAARIKPMNANPSTAHMFIANPLSGGTILNLFSTHPPIENRMERLLKLRGGAS